MELSRQCAPYTVLVFELWRCAPWHSRSFRAVEVRALAQSQCSSCGGARLGTVAVFELSRQCAPYTVRSLISTIHSGLMTPCLRVPISLHLQGRNVILESGSFIRRPIRRRWSKGQRMIRFNEGRGRQSALKGINTLNVLILAGQWKGELLLKSPNPMSFSCRQWQTAYWRKEPCLPVSLAQELYQKVFLWDDINNTLKIYTMVFCVMKTYALVRGYRRFGGTRCHVTIVFHVTVT